MSKSILVKVQDDIARAHTLPSSFYTEDQYFQSSKEKIFSQSWQLIVHKNQLQDLTQFPFIFLKDFIDEPLVLTQQNEKINCHSNVCTHRAHLVCEDACDKSLLRCRYHGRTFELNGKMKAMPGFDEVENFPTENDNLTNISTLIWKDFVFVSLNPSIDIQPIFNDIEHRLQGYEFEKLKFDSSLSKSYEIEAHWALYCENYLEEFHIPFVHKGLTQDINLNDYETILLENGVLQTAKCSHEKDAIKLHSQAPDFHQNMYAYYYWIFPNLMLNFYAWGLSVNIIKPISKNKTRIKYMVFTFPDVNIYSTDGADVGTVELEDQAVVQSVHQGIKSRYYSRGRYSAAFETGVHHFHKIIALITKS